MSFRGWGTIASITHQIRHCCNRRLNFPEDELNIQIFTAIRKKDIYSAKWLQFTAM